MLCRTSVSSLIVRVIRPTSPVPGGGPVLGGPLPGGPVPGGPVPGGPGGPVPGGPFL
jgi:hypothetical protein